MENSEVEPRNKNKVLVEVEINVQKLRGYERETKLEVYFNKQVNKCPICGSKTYYIRVLDRYYCFNCKDYLP